MIYDRLIKEEYLFKFLPEGKDYDKYKYAIFIQPDNKCYRSSIMLFTQPYIRRREQYGERRLLEEDVRVERERWKWTDFTAEGRICESIEIYDVSFLNVNNIKTTSGKVLERPSCWADFDGEWDLPEEKRIRNKLYFEEIDNFSKDLFAILENEENRHIASRIKENISHFEYREIDIEMKNVTNPNALELLLKIRKKLHYLFWYNRSGSIGSLVRALEEWKKNYVPRGNPSPAEMAKIGKNYMNDPDYGWGSNISSDNHSGVYTSRC